MESGSLLLLVLMGRDSLLKKNNREKKIRPACAGLWNTPMVHVDGSLTTCCLDEGLENCLGNLQTHTLKELWNGEQINRWREAQIEGKFEKSGPLCTRCNWRSAGSYPKNKANAWLERYKKSKTNK